MQHEPYTFETPIRSNCKKTKQDKSINLWWGSNYTTGFEKTSAASEIAPHTLYSAHHFEVVSECLVSRRGPL